MGKLIRIIKPNINAIANDWGYEYDFGDTLEVDFDKEITEYQIYFKATSYTGMSMPFAEWFINKYENMERI